MLWHLLSHTFESMGYYTAYGCFNGLFHALIPREARTAECQPRPKGSRFVTQKNRPLLKGPAYRKRALTPLGLGHETIANRLGRNPDALHSTIFIFNTNTLKVRLKHTLRGTGHVQTNTALALPQTLTNNPATRNCSLTCHCTFCHGLSSQSKNLPQRVA